MNHAPDTPIPAADRHEVAVVGYGPVGATLANLLGRAGIRTCVYERSVEPYPLPRACHLDAEIMRIFQGAGLGESMVAVVEPSRGMLFTDAGGNPLFDYEDFTRDPILGWHEDYVFIQPELTLRCAPGRSASTAWRCTWVSRWPTGGRFPPAGWWPATAPRARRGAWPASTSWISATTSAGWWWT